VKILVTGANGFSGKALVAYLENGGHEVATLSGNGKGTHSLNSLEVSELRRRVAEINPERVYHLAGLLRSENVDQFYVVNTLYASHLLEALEREGLGDCPVLLVGSAAEYGLVEAGELPLKEDRAAEPVTHYGMSKLCQTLLGKSLALKGRPVVMVRPFNLLGAGLPPGLVVSDFVANLRNWDRKSRPPIQVGNIDGERDFIDVEDAVRIYVDLMENPRARGEVVNVCRGQGVSVRGILDELMKIIGVEAQLETRADKIRTHDVRIHYGSTEKLFGLIGKREFTPFRQTLESVLRGT